MTKKNFDNYNEKKEESLENNNFQKNYNMDEKFLLFYKNLEIIYKKIKDFRLSVAFEWKIEELEKLYLRGKTSEGKDELQNTIREQILTYALVPPTNNESEGFQINNKHHHLQKLISRRVKEQKKYFEENLTKEEKEKKLEEIFAEMLTEKTGVDNIVDTNLRHNSEVFKFYHIREMNDLRKLAEQKVIENIKKNTGFSVLENIINKSEQKEKLFCTNSLFREKFIKTETDKEEQETMLRAFIVIRDSIETENINNKREQITISKKRNGTIEKIENLAKEKKKSEEEKKSLEGGEGQPEKILEVNQNISNLDALIKKNESDLKKLEINLEINKAEFEKKEVKKIRLGELISKLEEKKFEEKNNWVLNPSIKEIFLDKNTNVLYYVNNERKLELFHPYKINTLDNTLDRKHKLNIYYPLSSDLLDYNIKNRWISFEMEIFKNYLIVGENEVGEKNDLNFSNFSTELKNNTELGNALLKSENFNIKNDLYYANLLEFVSETFFDEFNNNKIKSYILFSFFKEFIENFLAPIMLDCLINKVFLERTEQHKKELKKSDFNKWAEKIDKLEPIERDMSEIAKDFLNKINEIESAILGFSNINANKTLASTNLFKMQHPRRGENIETEVSHARMNLSRDELNLKTYLPEYQQYLWIKKQERQSPDNIRVKLEEWERIKNIVESSALFLEFRINKNIYIKHWENIISYGWIRIITNYYINAASVSENKNPNCYLKLCDVEKKDVFFDVNYTNNGSFLVYSIIFFIFIFFSIVVVVFSGDNKKSNKK